MSAAVKDHYWDEAEKAKPSGEPSYWAKKSCNVCYGRGIVGQITSIVKSNTIVNTLVCDCGKRRFVKWRDAWIADFKKRQTVDASKPVLESPTIVDIPA